MSKVNKEKDQFFFDKVKAGDYNYDPENGVITNRHGKKLGTKNSRGYITIGALNNGKLMIIQAHRVACMIKTSKIIPEDLNPNHKDGDKTNNKWDNLELVTQTKNVNHALENNLTPRFVGEKNVNAIFNNDQVVSYRKLHRLGLITKKYISKKHNCCMQTVRDMLSGKTYTEILP